MALKSKRLASLMLTLSVCLSGCGINPSSPASDGTDIQQGAQGENVNPSAEGNESRGTYVLEELNFPDPELGLAALQKGEVTCMPSPFQLTQDGYFYRQVTIVDQESGTQQGHYIQMLDVSDDENLTFTIKEIPAVYSGEDGEYSLEDVYLYQGAPAFFQASDGDEVSCLAGCNENGDVEEISGELPEAIQSYGEFYTST